MIWNGDTRVVIQSGKIKRRASLHWTLGFEQYATFYNGNEIIFSINSRLFHSKGLFTWSGGSRSSGVGFFCFHALGDTKQKKPTH